MKLSAPFRNLLCAVLTCGAAEAVRAQAVLTTDVNGFASDVRNYNLVSLGNATFTGSSDTQGGIAVGGNLSIAGGWTIGSTYSDDPNPELYLNSTGTLTMGGTVDLNTGFASIASATTANGWTFNDPNANDLHGGGGDLNVNSSDPKASIDPDANAGPTGWNWTTETSGLKSISSSLSTQTATGTIAVNSQNLDFTSTATSGVVVFDLNAAQLSGGSYNGNSFDNISISVPTGVDYVINVLNLCDGQTLFGSGANFNSGTNDDQLLWNFVDTGSAIGVTVSDGGNFYGSVLAPNVNITDNTTIDGQVAAASFTDSGVEMHDLSFDSVVEPEAPTFALCAVALCGGMVLVCRRFRLARS